MADLEQELGRLAAANPRLRARSPLRWEIAEETAVSYPENSHALLAAIEPQSYWFNHRNDVIAAVVKRFPPGGAIYDVGGGNGYVSLRLSSEGREAIVIEPGPRGAEAASARGLAVVQAAFETLNIETSSVPSAGLFDVLEHIEDDLAATKNLYRILRPRGRLYLSVPAHQILWSREDEAAGHFRRYSIPSATKVLKAAGFQIDFASYFFSILVMPIFLVRALPTRLGIRQENRAEETTREHSLPDNLIGRIFRRSFKRELGKIESGQALAHGASCIIAARKP